MESKSDIKSQRILSICTRLERGEIIRKAEIAQEFNVTERSVQRDIGDLRAFFAEQMQSQDIIYDTNAKGYRLTNTNSTSLSKSELLAVCKILLESRSMVKEEMMPILDKLLALSISPNSKQAVYELVANEKFLYIEPHHAQRILPKLWDLGEAIQKRQILKITYQKLKHKERVCRIIEPAGLLFSEYYFYLVAFLQDVDRQYCFENPKDLFPTIYRVDRIIDYQATGEKFSPSYAGRFQEGEFRKRVQFMYGGKLQKVKFIYSGPSIEAVLDRLPTAQVLSVGDEGWTVQAEVFGKGIEMWLRSQGEYIKECSDE